MPLAAAGLGGGGDSGNGFRRPQSARVESPMASDLGWRTGGRCRIVVRHVFSPATRVLLGGPHGRRQHDCNHRIVCVLPVADPGGITAALPVLSLIHISEPTRLGMISYAVFCLKKKK